MFNQTIKLNAVIIIDLRALLQFSQLYSRLYLFIFGSMRLQSKTKCWMTSSDPPKVQTYPVHRN